MSNCWLKKKCTTFESYKLSFLWGKMRTAAWQRAFQMALKSCSKEARGRSVYKWFWNVCSQACIFSKRLMLFLWSFASQRNSHLTVTDFRVFLAMEKYKNWAHKTRLWKYLAIQILVTEHRGDVCTLLSTLNSFLDVLKSSSCNNTWFNSCGGGWQMPTTSANLYLTIQMSNFESTHCLNVMERNLQSLYILCYHEHILLSLENWWIL